MATILDHWQSCDGYNAACLLSNGERMTFHWLSKPKDVQVAADKLEAAHLARLEDQDEWEVIGEQL